MALIECPDCGGYVSSAASACPYCGRPLKKVKPPVSRPAGIVLQLIAAGLLVNALMDFIDPGEADEITYTKLLFGFILLVIGSRITAR
jgi:hypothetical protein